MQIELPGERPNPMETPDLSIVIPVLDDARDLAALLPGVLSTMSSRGIQAEVLVVAEALDQPTRAIAQQFGAILVRPGRRGYGAAVSTGLAHSKGAYILTMDPDLSHPPAFVGDLWANRGTAEIVIASRYAPGGAVSVTLGRYGLSRVLNLVFARGLSLRISDMSSGFRLYKAAAVKGRVLDASNFDFLQEILVRAYADGWTVREIPFRFAPRRRGIPGSKLARFGLDYLRTFWHLWQLRNSILAADYDDRAYDGTIFLQRYWQRSRFRHVVELIMTQGRVLDVGCGSSRILGALRPDSIALDILFRKLRYARRFARPLIQASGFSLPFADGAFPCVLCSQVIEHVPKQSPILQELVRVLAPGGRLVLGTPDYGHWEWIAMEKLYGLLAPGGYADEHIAHYTRAELIQRLGAAGLELEDTRYILRGEMILAFRKRAP